MYYVKGSKYFDLANMLFLQWLEQFGVGGTDNTFIPNTFYCRRNEVITIGQYGDLPLSIYLYL